MTITDLLDALSDLSSVLAFLIAIPTAWEIFRRNRRQRRNDDQVEGSRQTPRDQAGHDEAQPRADDSPE
ncbi:hypothetical protein [Nonomuraea recticatena]|uniref:Uncharacterized protein n=1 Tax=Nonomuraea recticatena TaxID=46178 RepID=A0ABN3T4N7_9ACTN